jgi:hypothetical protein
MNKLSYEQTACIIVYFTLIYCYLYVVFSVHVIAKTLNNVKAQALSFL